MNSVKLLKYTAVAALGGFLMACSSAPKVVEPAPESVAKVSRPVQLVDTARGPSLTLKDVLFDFEQATLRPDANSTINQAATYLRKNPERNALVEGHTDHIGDSNYNHALSEQRASAIRDALTAEGVSTTRIKTLGLGETQPVADNQTLTGRQANRRVEIIFQLAGTTL